MREAGVEHIIQTDPFRLNRRESSDRVFENKSG